MENKKNKKSVKFQGDTLNFYDFIQVFVFTTNHHLNGICQLHLSTTSAVILCQFYVHKIQRASDQIDCQNITKVQRYCFLINIYNRHPCTNYPLCRWQLGGVTCLTCTKHLKMVKPIFSSNIPSVRVHQQTIKTEREKINYRKVFNIVRPKVIAIAVLKLEQFVLRVQ